MKSFAEVLKQKLNQCENCTSAQPNFVPQTESTSFEGSKVTPHDPNFHSLIFKIAEAVNQNSHLQSKNNPHSNTSIFKTKNPYKTLSPRSNMTQEHSFLVNEHQLNDRQKMAWEFYNFWGSNLSLSFNKQQLKNSFRNLAKKLHPDHGGNVLAFRRLLEHHKYLLSVFS